MVLQKFLNKCLIICLCLLVPFRTFGQVQTSTGTFSILHRGDVVKFDGVLFDPYAVGTILTDKENSQKLFDLKLQLELDKQSQKYLLDKKNLELSITSQNEVFQKTLLMKDKEIEQLQDVKGVSFWDILLYVGAGASVGAIGMGITIGLLK